MTRTLLLDVEELIDLFHKAKVDELETLRHDHNLLFGNTSLVDAFLKLADITLMLDRLPSGEDMKVVERSRCAFLLSTYRRSKVLSLRKQTLKAKAEVATKPSISNSSDHTETVKLTKKEKKMIYIQEHYS